MKLHFNEYGEYVDPVPSNICSWTAVAAAFTSAAAPTAVAGLSVGALGTGAVLGPAGITGLGVAGSAFTLGNAFSVFSGISSLAQGLIQGGQLDAQSELENLRARGELLEGQRQIVADKEQFIIDLASFNARAGGSGVAPNEGSALAAKTAAQEDLDFQTSITRTDAAIRSATRRSNAKILKSKAGGARFSGISGAVAAGFKVDDRLKRRGSLA